MYGSIAPFVDYHVDVLQHGRVDVAIHRLLHDNLVQEKREEIREAEDRRIVFALYFFAVLFACIFRLCTYLLMRRRKEKNRRDHRIRKQLEGSSPTNMARTVAADHAQGNDIDNDVENNDDMWSMLLKDKLFEG